MAREVESVPHPFAFAKDGVAALWDKLIKIEAKVVGHAKYVTFQLAEVAVAHELFAAILERIQGLGVPGVLI